MIIQPDFPEHWKTRLLVKITSDESAPLAVVRLWAHCQHSRRDKFPDMTPAQLASVCHWDNRKPACHVALVKAGFVERLTPKGFRAHQWSEHNAQLLQKWQAGQKGGRPPTPENPNEIGDSGKPTDNRPLTAPKPDRLDQIDQTRLDRSDSPDQTRADGSPLPAGSFEQLRQSLDTGKDGGNESVALVGGKDGLDAVKGLASSVASKLTPRCNVPNLVEVRTYLQCAFHGAADYAGAFYKAMERSHWKDKQGRPITNWKAMAKSYASKCAMGKR